MKPLDKRKALKSSRLVRARVCLFAIPLYTPSDDDLDLPGLFVAGNIARTILFASGYSDILLRDEDPVLLIEFRFLAEYH